MLRPFWWVAHAVTGYKIIASWLGGAFVVGIACGGGGLQDINSVRNLASYLSLSGDPIPLAADGRIDVYIFVRTGAIEGEDDLQVYVSALTGQGPTLEEMLAGDYTNFPYERYRGEVSPNELGVPLIMDNTAAPVMNQLRAVWPLMSSFSCSRIFTWISASVNCCCKFLF